MSDIVKLQVSTVRAAIVPKGKLQITAGTRATKDKVTGVKKEIAADQRSRSIIIDEFNPSVESKYVSLVTSALSEVAKVQLTMQWENDPMLREVDAALYTEDALLLFAARDAESKKLSKETIEAWFNASELKSYLVKQYSEAQVKKFLSELQNIAAPVMTAYNEEKALKRIVTLGKFDTDVESPVAMAMIARLQRFVDELKKQREEIGSVEEIPE